ncbi:MAG: hypothetical protein MJ114_00330 [Acetatifactor sp.]|nr:hypothetical protein [Acetatifactor sp.]
MKCEFCDGTLNLEDAVCPHCGRPNTQAQKHIQDMKRYQGEFEETKEYVKKKTESYSQVVVRVVILGIMLLITAVFFILGASADSIKRNQNIKEGIKRFDEYSAILDGYLAEGEYTKFNAFMSEKDLRVYSSYRDSNPYTERYSHIRPMVECYINAVDSIERYVFESSSHGTNTLENMNENLDYFYKRTVTLETYYYGEEPTDEERELAEKLNYNMKWILCTYCGLTEEEAEELPNMTKSKRGVLLEEKKGEVESDE